MLELIMTQIVWMNVMTFGSLPEVELMVEVSVALSETKLLKSKAEGMIKESKLGVV